MGASNARFQRENNHSIVIEIGIRKKRQKNA